MSWFHLCHFPLHESRHFLPLLPVNQTMNFYAADLNSPSPYPSNSYPSSPFTAAAYPQFLDPNLARPRSPSPASESYIHASEVVILEPQSFSEIPSAVHILRSNQVVVLNLANMANEEAQRSVDFIAGGAYMCQGSLEKIDINIFLLTPQSTNIRVEGNADQTKATSPQATAKVSTYPEVSINPPNYFISPRAS
ncbi:MAG: cell division protein SepF [Leptolyngbya sp. DLM2.Bin15]|nr:MAG: cell division protein SepF [Leptolyngbya sp. DLM2.Bin15]